MVSNRFTSTKVSLREKAKEFLLKCFEECDKGAILEETIKMKNHESWLVRNELLSFIFEALKGFKLDSTIYKEALLEEIASLLDDPKAKIRARCLDTLAFVSNAFENKEEANDIVANLVSLECFEAYLSKQREFDDETSRKSSPMKSQGSLPNIHMGISRENRNKLSQAYKGSFNDRERPLSLDETEPVKSINHGRASDRFYKPQTPESVEKFALRSSSIENDKVRNRKRIVSDSENSSAESLSAFNSAFGSREPAASTKTTKQNFRNGAPAKNELVRNLDSDEEIVGFEKNQPDQNPKKTNLNGKTKGFCYQPQEIQANSEDEIVQERGKEEMQSKTQRRMGDESRERSKGASPMKPQSLKINGYLQGMNRGPENNRDSSRDSDHSWNNSSPRGFNRQTDLESPNLSLGNSTSIKMKKTPNPKLKPISRVHENSSSQVLQSDSNDSLSLLRQSNSSVLSSNPSGYIEQEHLLPFDSKSSVSSAMNEVSTFLKSEDWSENCQGLNTFRRLIKFHSSDLSSSKEHSGLMHGLLLDILKSVDSLRSYVSKTAMMTLNELIASENSFLVKKVETDIEIIFQRLLKRAMDSNAFILQEVKSFFKGAGQIFSENKLVPVVSSYSKSKNIQFRLFSLICLEESVKKKAAHCPNASPADFNEALEISCDLISDSSAEIRSLAKNIIMQIQSSVSNKKALQSHLEAKLGPEKMKKLEKIKALETSEASKKVPLKVAPAIIPKSNKAPLAPSKTSVHPKPHEEEKLATKTTMTAMATMATTTSRPGVPRKPSQLNEAGGSQNRKPGASQSPFHFSQRDSEDFLACVREAENNDHSKRSAALEQLLEIGESRFGQILSSKFSLKYIDTISKLMKDQNLKVANAAIQGVSNRVVTSMAGEALPENFVNILVLANLEGVGSNNASVRTNSEVLHTQILESFDQNILIPVLTKNFVSAPLRARLFIFNAFTGILINFSLDGFHFWLCLFLENFLCCVGLPLALGVI